MAVIGGALGAAYMMIGAKVRGRGESTAQMVADWQDDVCSMDDHTGYFFSLNRYLFSARATSKL